MKTPAVFVSAALTVAILLAASFLIATATRGEEAHGLRNVSRAEVAQRSPLAIAF